VPGPAVRVIEEEWGLCRMVDVKPSDRVIDIAVRGEDLDRLGACWGGVAPKYHHPNPLHPPVCGE
jgi:hypothetical protein